MREYPKLVYHDKEMDPKPRNIPWALLITHLMGLDEVYVQLEPGDGSRYDLTIKRGNSIAGGFPYGGPSTLILTRWAGGEAVTEIVRYPAEQWDLHPEILRNNEWTNHLFVWWLNIVFDHVRNDGT